MVRDIIFRGWFEDKGIMVDDIRLGQFYFKQESPIDHKHHKLEVYNASAIMQFTGLRDCRGRNIFEGDILLFEWGSQPIKEKIIVEWYNHGWNIAAELEDDEWEHNLSSEHKIIGNIYQHKHLLKKMITAGR